MAAIRSSQLHTSTRSESPLLGLPAEIRNEILRMVLVHHEPVSIGSTKLPHNGHTAGWPDIADTCKQLREEALPVFFGNNNFIIKWDAICQSLRHTNDWLRRFKAAPLSVKRLIKSLEIDIAQGMIAVEKTEYLLGCDVREEKMYTPLFRQCSTFLSHISVAGLMPHQLAWPGVHRDGMSDLLKRGRWGLVDSEQWDVWLRARLFNGFVLSPLLREHELYDDARPPVDVVQQFEEGSEGTECEEYASSLAYSGNIWRAHVPCNWYWGWLAEEEG